MKVQKLFSKYSWAQMFMISKDGGWFREHFNGIFFKSSKI